MGLYKRGKNWWMSFVVPGLGPRCQTTGTSNKRLARKILDIKRAEIVEGRYANLLKSNAPKLKEWLVQFLATRTELLHPNTRKRYECSRRNLDAFFAEAKLSDINEARIEDYKRHGLAKGMRAAGLNRDLSFLRLALRQAKRERYIAFNPLDAPDLFMNERRERRKARPFTLGEEQRLLAVANGYLKPLILLLVDAGLRVGKEALPLRWNDVDLQSGVVHVRQSKTPAGIRSVPLTNRLKDELVRWKRLTGKASEFVFPYPIDSTKHLQKVPKTWATALRKAGVDYRRIYDLRSTFCSRLNAAGVPPVFVEQLMGHSGGLGQTYSRIDEFRKDAIIKLELLILSKSGNDPNQIIDNSWIN